MNTFSWILSRIEDLVDQNENGWFYEWTEKHLVNTIVSAFTITVWMFSAAIIAGFGYGLGKLGQLASRQVPVSTGLSSQYAAPIFLILIFMATFVVVFVTYRKQFGHWPNKKMYQEADRSKPDLFLISLLAVGNIFLYLGFFG